MSEAIQEFVVKHDVCMRAIQIDRRPDGSMDAMGPGSTHWRCTLRAGGQRMQVYYSMGGGCASPPNIPEVLDCLAGDASSFEVGSFEEFCSDLGWSTDSRKAYATYQLCARTTQKLIRVFGYEGYSELLFDVERM